MEDIVELKTLDRTECLGLLALRSVGRVVFTDAAMPAAFPVNYRLVDTEVIFRVTSGGRLAAATKDKVIAFQVDDIDPRTHTGWSVLGVGEAYEVVDQRRLGRLAHEVPAPWPPHHSLRTMALPLRVLSGRRLALAGWASDALCSEAM